MFPILNPNSLARGGRTNLDEIDLDRRLSDSVCNRRPFSERLAIVAAV
jgi:hypothetical protein